MEKEKFVHRNLGARNILVGDGNNVKIAGFGMTKVVDDPDFNFRRGKSSNARKLSNKHWKVMWHIVNVNEMKFLWF